MADKKKLSNKQKILIAVGAGVAAAAAVILDVPEQQLKPLVDTILSLFQ